MRKNNPKNRYQRFRGNLPDKGPKKRRIINFNLSKIVPDQGQTLEEWNKEGLLLKLNQRMKIVGALTREEALHQRILKEYSLKKDLTEEGFPKESKFKKPSYLNPERWAVMHLTNKSIEVVAGYIEDDIFYIVFPDKDHHFWPTDIQERGKNKR